MSRVESAFSSSSIVSGGGSFSIFGDGVFSTDTTPRDVAIGLALALDLRGLFAHHQRRRIVVVAATPLAALDDELLLLHRRGLRGNLVVDRGGLGGIAERGHVDRRQRRRRRQPRTLRGSCMRTGALSCGVSSIASTAGCTRPLREAAIPRFAQRLLGLGRVLEPLRIARLQRGHRDRRERLGDRRIVARRRWRVALHDVAVRRLGIGTLVRNPPRHQLVHHRAPREHVGLRRVATLADRLGRRVAGRAHEDADLREIAIGQSRDSEIGELPAVVAGVQHVRRLDVAMDDALAMRERQRRRQIQPDLHAARERQPHAIEPIGERLARQILEHHERRAGVFVDADIEDRDDRRMRHLRGGLRLALEPLEERRPHAPALLLRRHDRLHRDDAIEQRIARLVDDAHRALADGLDDLVATDRLAGPLRPKAKAQAAPLRVLACWYAGETGRLPPSKPVKSSNTGATMQTYFWAVPAGSRTCPEIRVPGCYRRRDEGISADHRPSPDHGLTAQDRRVRVDHDVVLERRDGGAGPARAALRPWGTLSAPSVTPW